MQLLKDIVGTEYPFYEQYIIIYVLVLLTGLLIYGAWKLSNRPTLGYCGHLVQMFRVEDQKILRIISVNNDSVQIEDLITLLPDYNRFVNPEISSQTVSEIVSALVILSPSTVRASSNSATVTTVYLPSTVDSHVGQIYQVLQQHTDPSAAAAAIISLFRPTARRLSTHNHLLISQLISAIGTNNNNNTEETTGVMENTSELRQRTSVLSSTSSNHNNDVDQGDNSITNPVRTEERNTRQEPVIEPSVTRPLPTGNNVIIKIKFMDDTEKVIQCALQLTILEFKRSHFPAQLSAGKVIRLIFKGQLLRDDTKTLESYGVHSECVIHCHIGNRPYAAPDHSNQASGTQGSGTGAFGFDHIPQRPTLANLSNETWPVRILRSITYGAEMLPFLLFHLFSSSLTWIQSVEQVENEQDLSWTEVQINKVRRLLLSIIRLFVDFSVVNQPVDEMFMNRFNLGILFTLLFAFKFASIWFVVLYFPQYTDTKGVVMLTMLTVVFILYTFYNRPRAAPVVDNRT